MTVYSVGQNIYLRKGDTGQVTFKGIPTDKTYTAYLSVFDEETEKILAEVSVLVNDGEAMFSFSNSFSDSLKVGEWVYGLKICSGTGVSATEDTLLPSMLKTVSLSKKVRRCL